MSNVSAKLALPYLKPSQAQKHVTHNEALERLDILVQLTVEEFSATEPPSLPDNGAVYALGTGATGAWAGHNGELAAWIDDVWLFIAPREGWRAWGRETGELRLWDGTAWLRVGLGTLDLLGINATADTTNRLAVAAPATLLTHEGADHRLKIAKAGAGDTASLLFQTDFEGRAEMGTTGSDDFAIRVSPDGTAWHDGLVIDAASGAVSLPNGLSVAGQITGAAVTQSATDTTSGRVPAFRAEGILELGGRGVPAGDLNQLKPGAILRYDSGSSNGPDGMSTGLVFTGRRGTVDNEAQLFIVEDFANRAEVFVRARATGGWPTDVMSGSSGWKRQWSEVNTTVDSNGFIKEASPIVRLFDDRAEEPVQEVGAVFVRHGSGHYTLSGVPPLASKGWRIEVPQDHNGNRLVHVETDYDTGAGVLSVITTAPVWSEDAMVWMAGAPRDIPEDRWVDLRFEQGAPEA